MKKVFFYLILFLSLTIRAEAIIIDLDPIGNQGFFKDVDNDRVWMDLVIRGVASDPEGQDYIRIQNAIEGTGFRIARIKDLIQLQESAPADPDQYNFYFEAMFRSNINSPGSVLSDSGSIFGGIYDDEDDSFNTGTVMALEATPKSGEWKILFGGRPVVPDFAEQDFGYWVVEDDKTSTQPVIPETNTIYLFLLGSIYFAYIERKRWTQKSFQKSATNSSHY